MTPLTPKTKKFLLFSFLTVFIVAAVFVFFTPKARAGFLDVISKPGEFVMLLINWIMGAIFWFFSRFVWLAAQLLEAVFKIEKFTDIPLVTIGWGITRGLCNMFFALILLVMAFSTVLQIETYGLKKTLPRLIIIALLINFSLMFAGLFIDFAQVLTHYFIDAAGGTAGPGGKPSISAQLMNGLNIAKQYQEPKNLNKQDDLGNMLKVGTTGAINVFMALVFGCFLIIIAAFVILAAAILMLVRVVWLWLLLIFAPIAWVSYIIPGLGPQGNLWEKWWSDFIKWTFFAPIYAFFLYLATVAIGSGSFSQAFSKATEITVNDGILSGMLQGSVTILMQYIVVIIILLGGLYTAQKFGIYGASGLYNFAKDEIIGGTGRLASRWAARGAPMTFVAPALRGLGLEKPAAAWEKTIGAALKVVGAPIRVIAPLVSPDVWKKATAAYRTRAENRSFAEVSGVLQDMLTVKGLTALIKGQPPPAFYQNIERNKVLGQRVSEINAALPDENQRAVAYLKTTDPIEKEALMRSLGSTNSINTLYGVMFNKELDALPKIREDWQKISAKEKILDDIDDLNADRFAGKISVDDYKNQIANLIKQKPTETREELQKQKDEAGITALANKYTLNPETFQELMVREFGAEANRVGNDIQALMTNNGNLAFTGTYKWDEKTNKPAATDPEQRTGMALTKFREWEPQKFWTSAHPDSIFQRQFKVTHDGKVDFKVTGLTGNGRVYVENLTGLHYGQMNRAQNRMLSMVLDETTQKVMKKELPKISKKLAEKFDEWTTQANRVMAQRVKKEKEE
jgi:hypothetical protein